MALSSLSRASLVVLITLAAFPASGEEPATFYNGLARPNGKQIARVGTDKPWLLITPDPSGQRAWLAIGPNGAPLGLANGCDKVLFLSPDDQGLFRSRGPCPVPPSLIVDHEKRVHATWGDGKA